MQKNSEVLAVKVSPKLYREIRKAAEVARRSVSDFVRLEMEKIVSNDKGK